MAMIGDPTRRGAAAVEHCPEDQEGLDELVELETAVCEQAMITNRYTQAPQSRKEQSHAENLETRQGEKNQTNDGKQMNYD